MRPRLVLQGWFLASFALAATALPALAQWQPDGMPACTAVSDQRYPNSIRDAGNGVIVTWLDHRGTDFDIYAQRLDGAGLPQWATDGVALCTATGGQEFRPYRDGSPIVADGAGGAIVAWSDGRVGGFSGSDIYAQHVLPSGAVDPAWPADGLALCTAIHDQYPPTIVGDGAGGAIVTWRDLRHGITTDSDVYAQHVLASGAVDPAWPANGRALCTLANPQIAPTMVADGVGGAIVTWQDFRNAATSYDIYAQHLLSSGAVDPAWPASGRALCTAANTQEEPKIVADGAGGAIVTWYDYRGGVKYDIYAQHVLSSGAVDPAWPVNGRALCTAPGDQDFPAIVGDGAGGAIVAWEDGRVGDYDIYAQHVLASGAVDPGWPPDGRALCKAANSQYYPAILTDGAGGAIVTWPDGRTIFSDIYAQRVNGAGVVQWAEDGVALCTADNSQSFPTIVGDGAGGAIVAWEDARSDTGNIIYALRVYASGGVAAVPPTAAPARFGLLAPYPNPSPSGSVRIPFELPWSNRVSAQVVDLNGRRVRTLAIDREFPAGRQALEWDGRNDQFARMPAGVYFIRLQMGGQADGRRLVLIE